MAKTLYVGNLPYETNEAQLRETFSAAGTVSDVRFPSNSKGFAFVAFEIDEEAEKAIEMFDGQTTDLINRPMRVNEARPREDRPARNFNNNRGGYNHDNRDRGSRY